MILAHPSSSSTRAPSCTHALLHSATSAPHRLSPRHRPRRRPDAQHTALDPPANVQDQVTQRGASSRSSEPIQSSPVLIKAFSRVRSQHLWSGTYDLGYVPLVSLFTFNAGAMLSGACFTALAEDLRRPLGAVARHRRSILGFAAACTVAIAPYTAVVLIPRVKALKEEMKRRGQKFA